MTAKWGHVLLLATPITESVPAMYMWFHNIFGRKFTGRHQARKRLVLNELAMTLLQVHGKVLTIFTNRALMLRLDVREYETGWYSTHHSGLLDVLLCGAR